MTFLQHLFLINRRQMAAITIASPSSSISNDRQIYARSSVSSLASAAVSHASIPQTQFYGVALEYNSTIKNANSTGRIQPVRARTAGASKPIEVEVDKPLGLALGQKPGGGVVITAIENGGNAAKAGLKVGDQVLYTSSVFGDELWPADKLGFTKTAVQAKPDSIYFVVSRGADVDVKKLTKRPAPPRFGRKLTEAQKARATHICLDCGYIYTLSKPFNEQPDTFKCPQCSAPKKRFAEYDVNTGKPIGRSLPPIGVILGLIVGAAGVTALVFYGLQ